MRRAITTTTTTMSKKRTIDAFFGAPKPKKPRSGEANAEETPVSYTDEEKKTPQILFFF